jgi:CRP/FNR family transcriptional regulator, cyclic AMP receptor protein
MATKKVEQGHYLFREGDPPDAMYVVKSGKFAVVKTKSNSEIVLAEIGPGSMVGEMAFFDNKPRSASVKALKEGEVIALPYKALHIQFSSFPEWAKAIMRTVNEHLRTANARIKALEKGGEEEELFPAHTITKLTSILNFVGSRYGKQEEEGLLVPGGILRNYTIQIFQEPTHKMQKLMTAFMELKLMKVEDIGEGKQRIVIYKPDLLYKFTEWYNEWLFKKEAERMLLKEEELKLLDGVLQFARKRERTEQGNVKVNLTEIQNDSMKELGYVIKVDDLNPLIEKKFMSEKSMEDGGIVTSTLAIDEIEKIVPFWQIVYSLKRITR